MSKRRNIAAAGVPVARSHSFKVLLIDHLVASRVRCLAVLVIDKRVRIGVEEMKVRGALRTLLYQARQLIPFRKAYLAIERLADDLLGHLTAMLHGILLNINNESLKVDGGDVDANPGMPCAELRCPFF